MGLDFDQWPSEAQQVGMDDLFERMLGESRGCR
jgi:hypothetical protein